MNFSKTAILFRLIQWTSRSPEHKRRRLQALLDRICDETEFEKPSWEMPRQYSKHGLTSTFSVTGNAVRGGGDEVAVVMQGPVVERDDMTYNTLSLYRETMPNAVLILSTWNDLAEDQKRRIKRLGVCVVQSDPPEYRGPQNVNLQLASTARGIQEAHAYGCRYTLKTRCDTRIHLSDIDQFCKDLIHQFPVAADSGQAARIVVLDFATRLFIPHHPSDIFMFGETEDLLEYWSPELFDRSWKFVHDDNFGKLISQPLPETMMCRRFLQSLGVEPKESIDDWWRVLAERFLVVDRRTIDHFWIKEYTSAHQPMEIPWDHTNMAVCHFSQWLQMFSGTAAPLHQLESLRPQQMYECYLDGGVRTNAA
jgi:hypothetical protein